MAKTKRNKAYSRFTPLSLNDYLAIDRTVLANERTILSYGRTSLALTIIGGSCIKLFAHLWIQAVGVVFLLLAGAVFVRGWVRYREMSDLLEAALEEKTGAPEHPLAEAISEAREKEAKKEE